jgi:apolipoprotein N-acyltransferase
LVKGRLGGGETAILNRLRGLAGWRAHAAAGLLGAIAALALPPLTLAPLLLISIPGLLALIDGAPSSRSAAGRGLTFGIVHHMVGLYWVTYAILVQAAEFWWAVPIAVPLLAAVLAAFIAVPCGLAKLVTTGWRRACVLAGLWVLGDIARQFVLSGFPWNPVGSVWEMPGIVGLVFMQPASWVGVGGLTLGALLLASAPALGARGRAAAVGVLVLWTIVGVARLHLAAGPAPGLVAVIAQGNVGEIEHRDHWQDPGWERGIFQRYLDLTRQGVAQARQVANGRRIMVVWPETASPFWLQQDPGARQAVAVAAAPAVATIAGTARQESPGIDHNSLLAVMPDGGDGGYYDKQHLVPYGEYFPSYLPIRLGERGWTPGAGLRTLHIAGLPAIGPLICYEAIFSAQVVVETDRPQLLVNITNDSWFGDSAGPRQHLAAARMRAIEEGLPMVRAANTGISAIIDAHGKVEQTLGLDRQGVLVGNIPGALPPTPFSRMGLAAPALLAIASCATGLGLGRKRFPAQSEEPSVQKSVITYPKTES